MRKIFPVFAVVLGAFWVYKAFGYGLWVRRGPGGGFFPLIGGLLTVLFGLIYLVGEIRLPTPAHIDKKFIYPIVAVFALLLCSYAIGVLPAMLLYIFLWLWRYEKYTLRFSATISLCTVAGLYAVFVYWLAVPLPGGMLGRVLFG